MSSICELKTYVVFVLCVYREKSHNNDADSEQSALFASALATFFRQVGYVNAKNSSLQDKWPTFVAKDKKTSFFRLKPTKVNGTFDSSFIVFLISLCGAQDW